MKQLFTFLLCGLTYLSVSQNFPKELRLSADGTRLQLGGHTTTGLYNESQIRKIELQFPTDNFWSDLTTTENEDIMGAVTIDGEFFDSVGVRFKGATSDFRNFSEKKSFNISMDAFIDGQDVRGYETLNLNGHYEDPSSIREMIFNHVGRYYTPALKTNMAELYINGTYWGPYLNVQQPNGEYMREWFLSNNGTRWRAIPESFLLGGGPGGPGGGRPNFGAGTSTLNFLGREMDYSEHYQLKKTKKEDPWEDLILGTEQLNTLATDDQLYDQLKDYLDIDKALWFLAHEIIFTDSDGYISKGGMDYYVYWEAETGRLVPLEYDGNSVMDFRNTTTWTPFYRSDNTDFPLANRLFASPDLRQRYLAHFRVILEDYFTPDYMDTLIDSYADQMRPMLEKDSKKLHSLSGFETAITSLKEHITQRRNFLLAHSEIVATGPMISDVTTLTHAPNSDENITITARVNSADGIAQVRLYYGKGLVGTFDRTAMTANGEGTYTATIPAFAAGEYVRYYVEATAADDAKTATYAPKGAEHDVYVYRVKVGATSASDIVINEFMASNDTAIADQDGEYDDWIELFNTTNQDIDLTGYFLSDNAENLDKYDIPDGTLIPANGYLTVWADEDGMQEGLHANFKLSASGEELFLVNPDTIVMDEITFGEQQTDISYARIPNGTGDFAFRSATFGINNDDNTTSLQEIDFANSSLLVAPNPAHSEVLIQLSTPSISAMQVQLFDMFGRLVWQETVSNHQLRLPVTNFPNGLYFVVVDDRYGKQLVINR